MSGLASPNSSGDLTSVRGRRHSYRRVSLNFYRSFTFPFPFLCALQIRDPASTRAACGVAGIGRCGAEAVGAVCRTPRCHAPRHYRVYVHVGSANPPGMHLLTACFLDSGLPVAVLRWAVRRAGARTGVRAVALPAVYLIPCQKKARFYYMCICSFLSYLVECAQQSSMSMSVNRCGS